MPNNRILSTKFLILVISGPMLPLGRGVLIQAGTYGKTDSANSGESLTEHLLELYLAIRHSRERGTYLIAGKASPDDATFSH